MHFEFFLSDSYNKPCQELDEYDSFYKKNIESYGYSSIYIQRSGQKRDGCGIFYKPDWYAVSPFSTSFWSPSIWL